MPFSPQRSLHLLSFCLRLPPFACATARLKPYCLRFEIPPPPPASALPRRSGGNNSAAPARPFCRSSLRVLGALAHARPFFTPRKTNKTDRTAHDGTFVYENIICAPLFLYQTPSETFHNKHARKELLARQTIICNTLLLFPSFTIEARLLFLFWRRVAAARKGSKRKPRLPFTPRAAVAAPRRHCRCQRRRCCPPPPPPRQGRACMCPGGIVVLRAGPRRVVTGRGGREGGGGRR